MDAVGSSEIWAVTYQTVRRHISEDGSIHSLWFGNRNNSWWMAYAAIFITGCMQVY
jgi:hypothetical protein